MIPWCAVRALGSKGTADEPMSVRGRCSSIWIARHDRGRTARVETKRKYTDEFQNSSLNNDRMNGRLATATRAWSTAKETGWDPQECKVYLKRRRSARQR